MAVPQAFDQPRSWFDNLQEEAKKLGAPGLAYVKVDSEGEISGPIAKFMLAPELRRIDPRKLAGCDRKEELGEIALDERHDRFALGIAEADVIFDELGPIGRQHEARVKHSDERGSSFCQRPRGRADDLVPQR